MQILLRKVYSVSFSLVEDPQVASAPQRNPSAHSEQKGAPKYKHHAQFALFVNDYARAIDKGEIGALHITETLPLLLRLHGRLVPGQRPLPKAL